MTLFQDLGLDPADTVIDMGARTGTFAVSIAEHCERVVAVDVSDMALESLREKMDQRAIGNIEVAKKGFLSYEHEGEAASFIFSKDALHHLPDFWNVEALKNMGSALAASGIVRLRDFVFSFDRTNSLETIESWIEEQRKTTEFTDEEINLHFRDEYSTYDFMLEAVGVEMLEATYEIDFYAKYTFDCMGDLDTSMK